jgi:hypothetical protein
MVPKIITPSDAERFRAFFAEAGYDEENLRKTFGARELPSISLRNTAKLLDRTREPSRLNMLLRWFWIGSPLDLSVAEQFVPPWFLTLSLDCGLLLRDGERLSPGAMLLPGHGFLIASDHTTRLDLEGSQFVLWSNPTTRFLSNFTVRRKSAATLDLGTGNGVLALTAAAHSQTAVGTDLNPRAIAFAAFNARLNRIENVEFLIGDTFEPVVGRTFDLIVSNPPFFITPSDRFLFCQNPLELDQLCRHLAREAPKYLNEDGYFQMLCEWAQVRGQPWRERVAEWFRDSGCDAWVVNGQAQDPSEYAQQRIRETHSSLDQDAKLYDEYMAYYRAKGVEAIHDGIIAMHRRSGSNWVLIQDAGVAPQEPFGDFVELTFSAQDFLQSHATDEQMLAAKPHLSADTRLEQILVHEDKQWKTQSLSLKVVKGFPFSLGVQPLVAEFLSGCDGNRTLRELIGAFAAKVDAPLEQVQKECLGVVRTLILHGSVLC